MQTNDQSSSAEGRVTREAAIEVRGLAKRFGDVVAIDGLDLEVECGTCLGLLGPNGAGKSTTIHILVGLLEADGGEVRVLGREWSTGAQEIRERIGVQLQETELNDKLLVREVLELFRGFYGDGRDVDEILEIVGLEEKQKSRYAHLSGGQKQRLALGAALVGKPELLVLDEPTTGLDPQARRRVWDVVREFKRAGGTVLLTTHYMDEAQLLSDHVVIVDRGRAIEEGAPAEIIDRFGARGIVELRVEDPEGIAHTCRGLDGVRSAEASEREVVLQVDSAASVLPTLVEILSARGVSIDDLRTHRPTLEDVFVERTGRHLRDA